MAAVIAVLGFLALLVIASVYGVLSASFVLSILWGWFITPLFGMPAPPMPLLAGLFLTVGYLTKGNSTRYKNHDEDTPYVATVAIAGPWLVLLFGWLIHLWAGTTLGVWGT